MRKETRLNLLVIAGLVALVATAPLCGYDLWNDAQSRWLLLRFYALITCISWVGMSNSRTRAMLGSNILIWMGTGIVFIVCPVIFTFLFLWLVVAQASHQSLAAVTPFLSALLVASVPYLAIVPAAIALGWRLDAFRPASRVFRGSERRSD